VRVEAGRLRLRLTEYYAGPGRDAACVKAYYEHDWRAAEAGFKQAIELDPSGATSWQWYGMCCLSLGRLNEGLDAWRTALNTTRCH